MARVKNDSFVGNSPSDVGVDAPTWRRVVENVAGDLALVYDKINGYEDSPMNHDGTLGRGARLGVPWINQTFSGRGDRAGQWGIDLAYTATRANTDPKSHGSFGSDTIIFGVPVFIPPGERDMTVMITGRGLSVWPWRVQLLLESDGSELYAADMTFRNEGRLESLHVSTTDNGTDGAAVGKLCLLLILADTTARQIHGGTTPDAQVRAYSLFAGPTRKRTGSSPPTRGSANLYNITTDDTPFTYREFDSSLFAPKVPLHSYLTGGLSRNINALIEYVTGWPVGGNADYTLEDDDTTDPTDSMFLAHTKKTLTEESEISWPLMAQAFGAGMLDGLMVIDGDAIHDDGLPPTSGMLDWYAIVPVEVATAILSRWAFFFPDFQVSTPRLKACTLALSSDTPEGENWNTDYKIQSDETGDAAFVTVSGTNLLTSKHEEMAFTPDSLNMVSLRSHKTADAAKDSASEICFMGTCLYFEQPESD